MPKLPLSVTISAAIHIVAVAWVGANNFGSRGDTPEPTLTEITIVEPTPPPNPPEPTGVDVRLLDGQQTAKLESSTPTKKPAKKTRPVTAAAGTGATISTGATASTEIGPGTKPEPGKRNTYFDMRRGARADLTMPQGDFDDLDHVPRGTSPARGVPATGQLEDSAGGRKKSDQDVFTAKIDRDGTVKMNDSRNLQAELSWNPAKLLSGRFDVTDYVMRKTKNDPYASRKLKFLDETRDERVEMGTKWKQQQLQQTTMYMRKNLERAWASSQDMAARKQALFELWDEIVETDGSDEILAEASRAARKAVIGFIRGHLPQGSEHAYTEGELLAFNAKRQSTATFAPY